MGVSVVALLTDATAGSARAGPHVDVVAVHPPEDSVEHRARLARVKQALAALAKAQERAADVGQARLAALGEDLAREHVVQRPPGQEDVGPRDERLLLGQLEDRRRERLDQAGVHAGRDWEAEARKARDGWGLQDLARRARAGRKGAHRRARSRA